MMLGPRVVSSTLGCRVLWHILHKMEPRGPGMSKSVSISLDGSLQTSVAMSLLMLGCFSILCTLCITDDEGPLTNLISVWPPSSCKISNINQHTNNKFVSCTCKLRLRRTFVVENNRLKH